MLKRRVCATVCVAAFLTLATGIRGAPTTIVVGAADDLQAALNAAQPGDVVIVEAGATFVGNFVLPVKTGTGIITVRSSAADAALPPADVRIGPADAGLLPKLRSANTEPALRTAAGAHHWRLLFLEFPSTFLGYGEIVRLGDGSPEQNTLARCRTTSRSIACTCTAIPGTARSAASRSTGAASRSGIRTCRTSRPSDSIRRRLAAGTVPDHSPSRTTSSRRPARTSCSAAATRRSRISSAKTSSYGATTCRSRWPGATRSSRRRPRPPEPACRQQGRYPPVRTAIASWRGALLAGALSDARLPRPRSAPTSPLAGAVGLTWAPVPGATEYRIYGRNQVLDRNRHGLHRHRSRRSRRRRARRARGQLAGEEPLRTEERAQRDRSSTTSSKTTGTRPAGLRDPLHSPQPGRCVSPGASSKT